MDHLTPLAQLVIHYLCFRASLVNSAQKYVSGNILGNAVTEYWFIFDQYFLVSQFDLSFVRCPSFDPRISRYHFYAYLCSTMYNVWFV